MAEKLEPGRDPDDLGDSHELTMNRATMFPVGVNPRIDSVTLRLRSTLQTPTPITLHLRAAKKFGDFSSKEDLAASTVTLAPGKVTANPRTASQPLAVLVDGRLTRDYGRGFRFAFQHGRVATERLLRFRRGTATIARDAF